MAGKIDKAKGRATEAAGALANDKSLKREGKLDQIVGGVKDTVESAIDTLKGPARKAGEKIDNAADKVSDTINNPKGPAEKAGRALDRATGHD